MKELTTEQKAQRYDEALEKAKDFYKGYKQRDNQLYTDDLESIFPELKESEDVCDYSTYFITYFKNAYGENSNARFAGIKVKDIIAWLEKQGKHANFRNKIQIGDNVTRNEDGVLVNLSQLKRVAKKDEKQGEQKPTTMSLDEAIEHCKEKSCSNNACALEHKQLERWLTELKELKERSLAWSGEDEKFVHGLIRGLAAKRDIHGHTTFSSDCIDITETIDWLKSLKDRYTWKPSKEQMEYLHKYAEQNNYDGAILTSLYNDLKKLREE